MSPMTGVNFLQRYNVWVTEWWEDWICMHDDTHEATTKAGTPAMMMMIMMMMMMMMMMVLMIIEEAVFGVQYICVFATLALVLVRLSQSFENDFRARARVTHKITHALHKYFLGILFKVRNCVGQQGS